MKNIGMVRIIRKQLIYYHNYRKFSSNLYPKVVPKFPLGKWSQLDRETAWNFYEDGLSIREIPEVSDRLEQLAAKFRDKKSYALTAFDDSLGNLKFKLHATNTHILTSLPSSYRQEYDPNKYVLIDSYVDDFKSNLDEISREMRLYHQNLKDPNVRYLFAKDLSRQMINFITSSLGSNFPHLRDSQVDEDADIRCFWLKAGYENEDIRGKASLLYNDFAMFQYAGEASYQIRTEFPVSPALPFDHRLCFGDHEYVDYTPRSAGANYTEERPMSLSGHWIGDPCEFVHLSWHVLGEHYANIISNLGNVIAENETIPFTLISSYASAVAQAYNLGFSFYDDITYPIVAHSIVTDGEMCRFGIYQLNTLQTWRDFDVKTKRNVFWYSDMIPLFNDNGINSEALGYLLQFFMAQTIPRNSNLRPFVDLDINDRYEYIKSGLDEGILPPKIGRFRYPRDSIYH